MQYIVMECHESFAVLLDEEGRFHKAANLHYQVGDTVTEPFLMKDPTDAKAPRRRIITSLIAAAACFVLIFGGLYAEFLAPFTAIYLRINPEVCIRLNHHGDVIALQGVNEDGITLLEGYDFHGKDRLTVTDDLIERAIDMGFLSAGGEVSVSIDTPDKAQFKEYGLELRENLTMYFEEEQTVTIAIGQENTTP